MSTATSDLKQPSGSDDSAPSVPRVPWNPWMGVLFVVFVYFGSQLAAGALVSLYSLVKHWSQAQAVAWANSSIGAQFAYIFIAEGLAVGVIYLFLKLYGSRLADIGFKRPRWVDPLYGLAVLPAYFGVFIVSIIVIKHFVPGLNVDQAQQLGFSNVTGGSSLLLTFLSLVILPPLAEEIMVRGFLYSSLKKAMPVLSASLATSAIFAAAHLPEGGAAGPLYIAAVDTFILSMFLVYLREKTGSLWASITLHALKNGIAFFALFVFRL